MPVERALGLFPLRGLQLALRFRLTVRKSAAFGVLFVGAPLGALAGSPKIDQLSHHGPPGNSTLWLLTTRADANAASGGAVKMIVRNLHEIIQHTVR
jgi:hypothetical protein